MKKRICIAAAVCLVLGGLFQGCAGWEAAPAAGEPEVLTLSSLNTVQDYLQEVVDEFNRDNPYNVVIQLETENMDNYKAQLPVYAASDDMPDIFFTWEAGYLEPLAASGRLMPLTGALEEDGWIDSFEEDVFEPLTFDGEIYAIPLQRSMTVVFYNKDVFEAAGLTVPETWEEFMNACQLLRDRGIAPMEVGSGDWKAGQLLLSLMAGVGGRPLYESLGTGQWMPEQMEQSLELMRQLCREGYVVHNSGLSVYDGEVAMVLSGDWSMCWYWSCPQIGAFLLPAVRQEHQGTYICSVDQCYAISASCANPEAACAFLKFLTSSGNQQNLMERTGQHCSTVGFGDDLRYDLQKVDYALYNQVEQSVVWIDRGIGGEVGTAFNQLAMAVISGRDGGEELEALRQIVIENQK